LLTALAKVLTNITERRAAVGVAAAIEIGAMKCDAGANLQLCPFGDDLDENA
jgi:hypothetical protein